ncbi:hypothetical protein ACHAXT_011738 [Thalassiosira profunda]
MRLLALLCNAPLSLALVVNRVPHLGRSQGLPPTLATAKVTHQLSHPLTSSASAARRSTSLQATASSIPSPSTGKQKTFIATSILVLLDTQFRSLFAKHAIPFPSSLAGCGALFASIMLLNSMNKELGDGVYEALNPGAALLAKWLPVFFVPSLITLPLAGGLGNAVEILKVVSVIIGGFFFTLFTTAWSVLGIRKVMGGESNGADANASADIVASTTPVTNPPPKAFGKTLFRTLKALAGISGISAVALTKISPASPGINPLRSCFLLFTTLSTFVFGANLPKSFTKAVHPLVTCTSLTWLAAKAFAALTESTFIGVLQTYKAGTLAPLSAGAGDVLLFLLGPAVVALACQMYGRKQLMRENIPEVGVSTLVSSLGGLYGTAAAVRLLGLENATIRLSLLSRNITSPLAMAIASILGADVSLAVTIVVLTGLFGANFGASILDAFGIKDPVARGLGIGAAAHGLGTAAFAGENDAFPFAAIAMALTASACTVLVSVPLVKRSVLKLALGV